MTCLGQMARVEVHVLVEVHVWAEMHKSREMHVSRFSTRTLARAFVASISRLHYW